MTPRLAFDIQWRWVSDLECWVCDIHAIPNVKLVSALNQEAI